MKLLFSAFTICTLLCSCSGSQSNPPATAVQTTATTPTKITIARDSIVILSTTGGQSYSIYYPSKAQSPDKAPILLCFDPHGDGSIPIDKYKKWADKLGVAIAGSNSSRNGLGAQEGQQIAANMIYDVNARLGFDKKNMALCGFSGGAKVAINAIAADGEISKLIYAGAVSQLNTSHPVSMLGFAGDQDMNYSDLIQFDESVKSKYPASTLIEFSGKHEWPDASVFGKAFYFLAIKAGNTDSGYVKNITEDFIASTKRVNSKSESLSDTYQECSFAVFLLDGIRNVSDCKDVMKRTEALAEFQRSISNKKESIAYETNQKQILMQAFQNQGGDWWTKVINNYKASSKTSDKRLLGFISLG